MNFELTEDASGRLWLRREPEEVPVEVCTVSRAARVLRRSRRQTYRYLEDGSLTALRKVLGEWLISARSVEHLRSNPRTRQPIPKRLQILFPEYDVTVLNAVRDRGVVISRVLDRGDRRSLRWLFRRFRPREIRAVVRADGARLLSPKSLRLWSLFFRVPPSVRSPRRGDPWSDRAVA